MENQGEITFATVKEIIGKTGKTPLLYFNINFWALNRDSFFNLSIFFMNGIS